MKENGSTNLIVTYTGTRPGSISLKIKLYIIILKM